MKIAAISAPAGVDFGLNAAFKIVCDTLTELGEDIKIINLALDALPHFDGGNSTMAYNVMSTLAYVDAVVLAMPVFHSAPCAMMLSFLEYFNHNEYRNILDGKNCLQLAVSQNGGERRALETVATTLGAFGAFDVVNIALNTSAATVVKKHVMELIERQAEDFYRIVRQNRKYIAPSPAAAPAVPKQHIMHGDDAKPAVNIEELYKKHSLNDINNDTKADIEKISNLFAQKYVSRENTITEDAVVPIKSTAKGGAKTCKQLTAALPHYFNPQLAKDIDAVIQLDITGDDGFSGHLAIKDQICEFIDGNSDKSDILVIADAASWRDVLSKRVTAQKAFMMGRLKVRGNFVLLTKFDQLFNPIR